MCVQKENVMNQTTGFGFFSAGDIEHINTKFMLNQLRGVIQCLRLLTDIGK